MGTDPRGTRGPRGPRGKAVTPDRVIGWAIAAILIIVLVILVLNVVD
jgi:hypothetical protein